MKRNFLYTIIFPLACILALLGASPLCSAQADKHIDPSPRKHKHTLTIGKHVSSAFTLAKAQRAFAYGTSILQTCNNRVNDNQDVAVAVSVVPGAALGTFGAAGDGLDVINTQAELDQVMNNKSFYVKVVVSMPGSGVPLCNGTPPILGCGGGSSIVMVEGLSDAEWGEVLIHEFGHNEGLPHRDSPGKPIMHTSTLGNTEVNDVEAAAFHKGGADDGPNRPVKVAFVVDDTGSMSEEIDGVKNGIIAALNVSSLFLGNSCDYVYQLTTFKDNVSQRDPSTDLTKVRDQVAVLFAAGGGDCPEGSVEAVDATKERVKDGGSIFLFTDASPHPGLDIETLKNALKARGIKVYVLLSGDCSSFFSVSATGVAGQATIPYSDNHDATAGTLNPPASLLPPDPSAVEAYSYLASETGGLFIFIPEVNSGDPTERLRFENIALNLIAGAVAPSLINAEPGKGPQGATVAQTVVGSNTHFNSTTSLSFSHPGIVVKDIRVLTPTTLSITLTIGAGVPLGYYDVTATTDLGDGTTEKTEGGKGLLKVVAAPTEPTIVSISPDIGVAGHSVSVKITGINTHFSDKSVPDLGTDITVSNVKALSDVELTADLSISASAMLGFHDVRVTTGSEVATENLIGPFLVISPTTGPTTWYRDRDGDGFGDPKVSVEATSQPAGYVSNNLDCNDYRLNYEDKDRDGWGSEVFVPCGGSVNNKDCDDNNNRVHSLQTFYRDADGDSYGNGAVSTVVCSSIPPEGYVANKLDCDDSDPAKRTMMTFYADKDKDGYGDPASPITICGAVAPAGYAHNKLDCDDHNPLVGVCPVSPAIVGHRALPSAGQKLPDKFTLSASPNPFNRITRILYTVPFDASVNIRVFDVLGREVVTIFNGDRAAGRYSAEYNTRELSAGIYYCRMAANANGKVLVQTEKLIKVE